MLRGKPLTAVIPVRGGSKGIPAKNLLKLGGRTLLERAIALAEHAPRIDRTLVSTDDPEMHRIAGLHGVAAPGLRPGELAADGSRTEDAVAHLIEAARIAPGYIVLLQVTSPLRTRADLEAALDLFEATPGAHALVSVCRHSGTHPAKMFRLEQGRVKPFMDRPVTGPRQALPQLYVPNGAFYVIDMGVLAEEGTFLPERTIAYEMPPERSANLDTMQDLQVLEAMLERGHWRIEDLG